ncbi:uncharacterized protein PG986_002987 [Apiospora aurea]|uniref:Transmembrane protein n=1 Tax=Apiospora aurea TaxID=335848 RepID=A0ABR1QQE1_9PEZI
MKVSTTLSALGLYAMALGLYAMALGAPTPVSSDKASVNPTTSLRDVLHRIHSKAAMGERMSIKGFFRHHLEDYRVAPSNEVSSSVAIEMHRPLPPSFIVSAASGSDSDSQSPVPEMEQSSTVRAETGFPSKPSPTTVEEEVAGSQRLYRLMPCQKHGGKQHYHLVRQYADMVVVGVLAVFLMAVAIIELWTTVSSRTGKLTLGRLRQWRNNEGAIRLGDEEKTPISSSPDVLRSMVPQLSTPALQPVSKS